MNEDDLLQELKSDCKNLNEITESYFVSNLTEPILGRYSFRDVEHLFNYALREYSITHSKQIEPYQNPSSNELLKMNNIDERVLEIFKDNVNKILKLHTDENWDISHKKSVLESQIRNFITVDPDEDTPQYKMLKSLSSENDWGEKKDKYLNDILTIMYEAEINQVIDNKYIVIEKLTDTYTSYTNYLDRYNFQEKKKYLKKQSPESQLKTLKKYVKKYLNDDSSDNPLKTIKWFIFYLVYDKHKVDIFFIHSILGYQYDGATKLYKKLFCKDHSTGKNDNFLHHTDFSNITLDNLNEENNTFYKEILHYL